MKDVVLYTLLICFSLLVGCVVDGQFKAAEEKQLREQLNNADLVIRDAELNSEDFMDIVGETDAYYEYQEGKNKD